RRLAPSETGRRLNDSGSGWLEQQRSQFSVLSCENCPCFISDDDGFVRQRLPPSW
ncbi:hypothetical protein NEUTE2DRAFT_51794, partial [Neurospora tetrasperma FGSC 2509]